MKKVLNDFLKNKLDLDSVKKILGVNLHSIKVEEPVIVCSQDVIFLINQYLDKKITLQDVLDWVNVVWFTDLFEYNEVEEDSIASVINELETMDEDGVYFSGKDFLEMIECLLQNREYKQTI